MKYYLKKKAQLIKGHIKIMAIGRPLMVERFGEELAHTAVAQTLTEFEQLIPHIPYIGGKDNPMTDTLEQMSSFLALYRVLKRHGRDVNEISDLVYEMAQAYVESYPRLARHLIGRFYMSRFNQRRQRQRALKSQERQFPGDFVVEVVEGDAKDDFAWGINYLECGVVKFFAEQDAEEFTPAMCRIDYLMFPALGIELKRTGTIAQGCSHCDFRFH